MFLADAVAGYVESLTERELDAPLIALLRARGFTAVHLTHGAFEMGKDFVAQRVEDGQRYQYCIQSKAGDINLGVWRDLRQQVDEMRTGRVSHPDFDPDLPRRLIVVTNGRLKGTVGVSWQEYNAHHEARGELTAQLWDIDTLAPMFHDVLIAGVPVLQRSRTLEILGQLGQGRGTRLTVRDFTREWFRPDLGPRQRWTQVLTASMLAREAARQGREDLGAQFAFQLVRVSWEVPDLPDADQIRVSAHTLFLQIVEPLWQEVQGRSAADLVQQTSRSSGLTAFVTHPVKVARVCESLALLGLFTVFSPSTTPPDEQGEQGRPAVDLSVLADLLTGLCMQTSALCHVVGDEWAYSVLVTCLFLFSQGHDVEPVLREVAVWVFDRIEYAGGVAGVGASAAQVVGQLLGSPYPSLRLPVRRDAYVLTVVIDLARSLGLDGLAADAVADLDAVQAHATAMVGYPPGPARMLARVSYAESSPGSGVPVAAHYGADVDCMPSSAAGQWFDVLATWAALRDRHTPAVLDALVTQLGAPQTREGATTDSSR